MCPPIPKRCERQDFRVIGISADCNFREKTDGLTHQCPLRFVGYMERVIAFEQKFFERERAFGSSSLFCNVLPVALTAHSC